MEAGDIPVLRRSCVVHVQRRDVSLDGSSDHGSGKIRHAHFADQLEHLQSAAMRHAAAARIPSDTAPRKTGPRPTPCMTQKNPLVATMATSGNVAR